MFIQQCSFSLRARDGSLNVLQLIELERSFETTERHSGEQDLRHSWDIPRGNGGHWSVVPPGETSTEGENGELAAGAGEVNPMLRLWQSGPIPREMLVGNDAPECVLSAY